MELELFVDVQPGTAPGTGHHPPDSAEDFRGVIKVWGLLGLGFKGFRGLL